MENKNYKIKSQYYKITQFKDYMRIVFDDEKYKNDIIDALCNNHITTIKKHKAKHINIERLLKVPNPYDTQNLFNNFYNSKYIKPTNKLKNTNITNIYKTAGLCNRYDGWSNFDDLQYIQYIQRQYKESKKLLQGAPFRPLVEIQIPNVDKNFVLTEYNPIEIWNNGKIKSAVLSQNVDLDNSLINTTTSNYGKQLKKLIHVFFPETTLYKTIKVKISSTNSSTNRVEFNKFGMPKNFFIVSDKICNIPCNNKKLLSIKNNNQFYFFCKPNSKYKGYTIDHTKPIFCTFDGKEIKIEKFSKKTPMLSQYNKQSKKKLNNKKIVNKKKPNTKKITNF